MVGRVDPPAVSAVTRSGSACASEEQIAWTADFQPRLFAAMETSEDLEPYREELGVAIRNGLDRLSEAQGETPTGACLGVHRIAATPDHRRTERPPAATHRG